MSRLFWFLWALSGSAVLAFLLYFAFPSYFDFPSYFTFASDFAFSPDFPKWPWIVRMSRTPALSAGEFAKLCARGSPEEIERAIGEGADIHAQYEEWNALQRAVLFNRNPDAVAVLLKYGADVNVVGERGMTLLIEAVAEGRAPEIVSALLAASADANVRDREGKKALDYARQNPALKEGGYAEAYRQLVSATGDDYTPVELLDTESFFKLCRTGTAREVEAIIRRGADVNALGKRRRTALVHAAGNRENLAVLFTLIRHGADVNVQDAFGRSSLQMASMFKEGLSAVALLLVFGADADARDHHGQTTLIGAVRSGKAEIVELLLAAGADAGFRDLDGGKALDYVAGVNKLEGTEAYRLLLAADRGQPVAGKEAFVEKLAFLRLCASGMPGDVGRMLQKGADPDTECGGITPLMLAAMRDDPELVGSLLGMGAHAEKRDGYGKCAADYVEEGGKLYGTDLHRRLEAAARSDEARRK